MNLRGNYPAKVDEKRPVEDPCAVSGGAEGVRESVLYHQPDGRIGADLSDQSLDAD